MTQEINKNNAQDHYHNEPANGGHAGGGLSVPVPNPSWKRMAAKCFSIDVGVRRCFSAECLVCQHSHESHGSISNKIRYREQDGSLRKYYLFGFLTFYRFNSYCLDSIKKIKNYKHSYLSNEKKNIHNKHIL